VGEESKWGAFYITASVMAFLMLMITRGDSGKIGVLGAMVLCIPFWLSNRRRLGKILIVLSAWCAVYAANQMYLSFLKSKPEIDWPAGSQGFLTAFTPFYPALFIVLAVFLLGAGLYLILLQKKWPERLFKIAGLVFLALTIIGGLLFVEIMGSRMADRPNNIVWQAREILHGRLDDSFGSSRGWVWKNGISVIRNNPWLGTGPDTFFFALGGVQRVDIGTALIEPQLMLDLGGLHFNSVESVGMWFDKAHNMFLQIAVCHGLPALLAYLIFLGALFIPGIRKAFNQPILLAFGAGSLSYLIQSFFQIDTPIDRPLIYMTLGVMAVELQGCLLLLFGWFSSLLCYRFLCSLWRWFCGSFSSR
jgi:O-antigen ligase